MTYLNEPSSCAPLENLNDPGPPLFTPQELKEWDDFRREGLRKMIKEPSPGFAKLPKLEWWENVRIVKDFDIVKSQDIVRLDVLVSGQQFTITVRMDDEWTDVRKNKRFRSGLNLLYTQLKKRKVDLSKASRPPLPEGAASARYLTKEEGPDAIEIRE